MSDDGPKTKELPAADPIAILTKTLEVGLRHIDDRLDSQDTKLDKVVTDGIETNTRLTRIETRVEVAETRVGDLEGRIGRTSTRVRDVSQIDMAQDALLAQAALERAALAEKVDSLLAIGSRLESLTKNPMAKVLFGMLITAAISWLAAHGGHL